MTPRTLGPLLVLLLGFATASAGESPNLLANPGFEQDLLKWNNWGGLPSDRAHQGNGALVISQTEPKWTGCDQRVLLSGKALPHQAVLSGWMRTVEVVKNKEAWEMARFVLNFYDDEGRMVGGYQASTGEVKGTTDWTRYERSYNVPPGTRQVEVQCALGNCAGTAYFDDLVLTVLDASGRPLARGVLTGPADEGDFYEVKPPREGEAGHWVDWSSLLDAPAGKHGGIRADPDGSLAFADGTPAKFWGTNLVGENCFPDARTSEATALRLSRMGCNLVRFHHMDAPWFKGNIFGNGPTTRRISPESLEKLDYLIYRLEQRGIYILLDLLVHRDFQPADGVSDKTPDLGGKQVAFFSRKLIELQKEYARQLLSHVNPHTGKAYRDDPAVVASEFINESSIFMHFGGDILTPAYREELEGLWNKAGHRGKKMAVFEQDYSDGSGKLKPRGDGGDVEGTFRFLAELEWGYFAEMRDALRQDGVPYLLAGSNWAPTLATLASDARLDLVISNHYWDHPQLWKIGNDWSRVLWAPFDNLSQIRMFETNSVVSLAYARAQGKPFLVTEWNECFPNEQRLEGAPLMAAYAALQGWNGFLQFDFDHRPVGSAATGNFTLSLMPDHLAQWVVAAPLFLRGDVKTAPGEVVENIPREQRLTTPSYSTFLRENPWVPYVTRYAKSFHDDQPAGSAAVTGYAGRFDAARKTAVSETGELTLEAARGVFRVETARLQGVEGALRGETFDFPALRVQTENPFASVFLVSADGLPLATSRRMFLVCVAEVKWTGQQYDGNRKQLEKVGGAPVLAQVMKGSVLLKHPDPGVRFSVRPLSTGGTPGKALPTRARSEGTWFTLDAGRTFVYEVTVARR